ncbi:MAG: hypothetical protein U0Q18_14715 [Bryobacteraceae bacterium]
MSKQTVPSRRIVRYAAAFLVGGAVLFTGIQQHVAAQGQPGVRHLPGYFARDPWTDGTDADIQFQTAAATTIPMSSYKVLSTKDNAVHSGWLVGTSPFASPVTGTTIDAVVIPLKVTIGSNVFDPEAPNSCDSNVLPLFRFLLSPLVVNVPNLTFNGINVGTTQYVNGFRRAEFWGKFNGSSAYQNPISYFTTTEYSISPGTHGITQYSGCNMIGIVSNSWLKDQIKNTIIPSLTASGVISPTKFAIFLTSNVVQSKVDPPTSSNCCILGYHTAIGNPTQTYAVMSWDTSGNFAAKDATTASHEIAEWMDDPLGNNQVPAWGGIGQQSGCQSNWENGDPLSGTLMPTITLGGIDYHVQELAFFNWFFAKNGIVSVGAGHKFSSNGTFTGPAKACPPGGTY